MHNQINTITNDVEKLRDETKVLSDLRQKVDGLLENIFNDEYGSELEARLELESEQLLALKQRISVSHYKWHNGKNLIHHACLQLAFVKRRWEQIKNVDPQYLQVCLHASQNSPHCLWFLLSSESSMLCSIPIVILYLCIYPYQNLLLMKTQSTFSGFC